MAEKQKGPSFDGPFMFGAAGRNRTHDPLVRSQVLYPAELQPRKRRDYIGISDCCNCFFIRPPSCHQNGLSTTIQAITTTAAIVSGPEFFSSAEASNSGVSARRRK